MSVGWQTLEPEKCEGWFWRTWDEIKALFRDDGKGEPEAQGKQNLFLPIINLMKDYPNIESVI